MLLNNSIWSCLVFMNIDSLRPAHELQVIYQVCIFAKSFVKKTIADFPIFGSFSEFFVIKCYQKSVYCSVRFFGINETLEVKYSRKKLRFHPISERGNPFTCFQNPSKTSFLWQEWVLCMVHVFAIFLQEFSWQEHWSQI